MSASSTAGHREAAAELDWGALGLRVCGCLSLTLHSNLAIEPSQLSSISSPPPPPPCDEKGGCCLNQLLGTKRGHGDPKLEGEPEL